MASLLTQVQEAAGVALDEGEEIGAALFAVLPRNRHSVLDQLGLLGAITAAALDGSPNQGQQPVSFKIPQQMALALTGRRIMVYSMASFFRPKPTKHHGDIALDCIDEVHFRPRTGKLEFWFSGGPTLEFDVPKKTEGHAFASVIEEQLGKR